MFNKKDISSELAESMANNLVGNTIEKKAEGLNKLATAIDHLNDAAETFDNLGMNKEAEALTTFLEIIAGKKSKKKSKPSKSKKKPSKSKKSDPATKGLTGEKMVDNLKEKGWVFNAEDHNDANDHTDGCMCSMCMDVNDVRHGDDCVCSICMKDDENDVKHHKSGDKPHYWDGHSRDECEEWSVCPQHKGESNIEEDELRKHWMDNEDDNSHIDIEESEPFNFDDTSIDRNHSDDDINYAEMFKQFNSDFEDEV
jgi:hypothetical protein